MKRKYVQAMMTGMTAMLAVTVPVTTVAAATPEKNRPSMSMPTRMEM